MKNLITLLFLSFIATGTLFAQNPPEAFNYSAVARDANNNPIANSTLGIQISLRQGSPLGTVVYQENHFVNTDQFGLFNLTVGGGSIQSGSMASIDWSAADFYMQVGMDANGGTNFLTMGTTQLLSVPYALHAKTADSVIGSSQSVTITGTGSTTVTGTPPNFTVNSTDAQNISLVGDVLSIQNGNSITLPLNLNSYGYSVMFNNVPISDPAINDLMIEPNVFLSENNYIYKLTPDQPIGFGSQKRYTGYFPPIDDLDPQFGSGYYGSVYYSNAGCTGTRYLDSQYLVGQVFATISGISYISDSATPTSVSTNSYKDLLGCTDQSQAVSVYTVLPNNPAITGVHFINTTPVQIEIVR
jgi:hypothetical protein